MKILGEVLESWSEDNVSPDYGFEPSLDASMEFLTLLGQMGYSIVATSSLPTSEPAEQLTPQELAEFDKSGRLPEEKKPRTLPTKEALAAAISKRYGGRPVPADEIIDVRDFTAEDEADQTIQFQAWRNAMVDWYEAKVNSAGQVDEETLDEQIAEGLHEWINESYDNHH